MMLILLSVVLEMVVAVAVAWLLQRHQRNWSNPRIVFISALPIPLVILALCAYVFGSAATASQKECGVDACGMAMMAATFGGIGAVLLYLIGLAVSAVTVRSRSKPQDDDVADIFS